MVDTHTHHLDLRRFGYPWLAAAEYEPLRRDYLPGDYLADVAGAPVEGWVHVQAEIGRSVDPASETQWVSGLAADARAAGLPGPLACVVYADLKAPDLVEALGRQCGSPETRGVRQEVWFDPRSTRIDAARENLLADPGWREGYRMLAHFGLSFDLLVWPEQLPVAPPRGPAQRMIRPAGRHVYGFMLHRKARTSATSPGGAPARPRRRRSHHRRSSRSAIPAHRSFDPRRVGSLEADAWVAYYRREWFTFLRSAVALTRHTFGLSWPATFKGAWLVLRANQLWAPVPDNDPDGARRTMARFYALVRRTHGDSFDPVKASELEVEWWREHREHQRGDAPAEDESSLIAALVALYSYVYAVSPEEVRVAAEQRALAMRYSDRWVSEGCKLDSPLIPEERAALIRSYAGLLAAVHRV